jgi:DNA modification methylase
MTVINQASGKNWQLFHGDCCEVAKDLPDNSIDFCIHSPPFSALYIYSDSEADMGNCADHEEFFRHYSYLIRELYRVMVVGRLVAIHCKDLPKYANRDGTSGLFDFPGMCIKAFEDAGFCFHSRVTIWKCPVTERERTNNNGLLHKTVKRDRSQIRQGMADYLIVMRKPPVGTLMSDKPIVSNGFDQYIGTEDPRTTDLPHPSKYARTGTLKAQSLNEEEVESLAAEIQANEIEWGGDMTLDKARDEAIRRMRQRQDEANSSVTIWRRYAEPVWWDIDQTNVLNFQLATSEQDEKHICPLQLDVIKRSIQLWSDKGEVVLSPFAGVGSEGVGAIELGRKFVGIELKQSYFDHAQKFLRIAEAKAKNATGTLFGDDE